MLLGLHNSQPSDQQINSVSSTDVALPEIRLGKRLSTNGEMSTGVHEYLIYKLCVVKQVETSLNIYILFK